MMRRALEWIGAVLALVFLAGVCSFLGSGDPSCIEWGGECEPPQWLEDRFEAASDTVDAYCSGRIGYSGKVQSAFNEFYRSDDEAFRDRPFADLQEFCHIK